MIAGVGVISVGVGMVSWEMCLGLIGYQLV